MSCCGGNKARVTPIPEHVPSQRQRQSRVVFRYTGNTRLWVTGPITRQQYFFASHKATSVVDSKDATAIGRVPKLIRIH